jgi:hypothetical protein
MRSNLRTIIDDLPSRTFDDNHDVAQTIAELAANRKCQYPVQAMAKLAREKCDAGVWEQVWRHVPGKKCVPVYRLATGKKKK